MAVTVELFKRQHLSGLKDWGVHKDPRFEHYDFKYFKRDEDYRRWFKRKQTFFTRRLFAILDDDVLVGFLTMKNIKWLTKRADFGIVLDPNKLGCGYGSEAMRQFLSLYFMHYKFEKLTLYVADFNRRAMRVYSKNGFVITSSNRQTYEIQSEPFAIILAGEGAFTMEDGKVVTLVHTMVIDRQRYISANKEALCQP